MTCTNCKPNSLEGTLLAKSSAGATLASVRVRDVLSGYSHTGSKNTKIGQRSVQGHPVMEVPAQPGRQVYEIGPLRLNEGRQPPRIQSVSVWVARQTT